MKGAGESELVLSRGTHDSLKRRHRLWQSLPSDRGVGAVVAVAALLADSEEAALLSEHSLKPKEGR